MAYVNITSWTSSQVVDWIKGLVDDDNLDSYSDEVTNKGITGDKLLKFSTAELENLGITKVGHQQIILDGITQLSNLHYRLEDENAQSLALDVNCKASNLISMLKKSALANNNQSPGSSGPLPNNTVLLQMNSTTAAVRVLVQWLDRPPFSRATVYERIKKTLIEQSTKILSVIHGEETRASNIETLIQASQILVTTCDDFVKNSTDPLVIQPAQLEQVVLKKQPHESLGMVIKSTREGNHIITETKEQSPAEKSRRIDEGDEVVQVNYRTVIGWHLNKLVEALKEDPAGVTLLLKKRPKDLLYPGQLVNRKLGAQQNKNLMVRTAPPERKQDNSQRPPPLDALFFPPPPNEPYPHSTQSEDELSLSSSMLKPPPELENCPSFDDSRRHSVLDVHRRARAQTGSESARPVSQDRPRSFPSNISDLEDIPTIIEAVSNWSGDARPRSSQLKSSQSVTTPNTAHSQQLSTPEVKVTGVPNSKEDDATGNCQETPPADGSVATLSPNEDPVTYIFVTVGGVIQKVPVRRKESSIAADKILESHRGKPPLKRIKVPSRRISCHDLGVGECEGWLMKKEEHKIIKSSWKKRWVVLKEDYVLYIFKQKTDEKALALICLPGYQVKEEPKTKHYFPFRICHPKIAKNFLFGSERKEDWEKWVEKLTLATLAESEWPGDLSPPSEDDPQEVAHFSESDEDTDSPKTTPRKVASGEVTTSHESICSSSSSSGGASCGFSPTKENDSSRSSFLMPLRDPDSSSLAGSSSHSLDNLNTTSEGRLQALAGAAESVDDLLKLYDNIQDSQVQVVDGQQKSASSDFGKLLKRASSVHHNPNTRKIFRKKALELSLKDKEESLEAITQLLSKELISSEDLREWADSHPYLIQPDSPYNTVRRKRKEEKVAKELGEDCGGTSRSSSSSSSLEEEKAAKEFSRDHGGGSSSSSEESKTPTGEDSLGQPQLDTETAQPPSPSHTHSDDDDDDDQVESTYL